MKIKPIFKVNDILISKNSEDYCKIIDIDEEHQYYKIINLNSVLKLEDRLYFTHQHNFFVKDSYSERYKKIGESEWFNAHYSNKSLGETIDIVE